MGKWSQFTLLLWKNYLIQRRKIFLTLFEIGLPTFFGLILLLIRFRVETEAVLHGVNWTECKSFHLLPSTSKIPRRLTYAPINEITTKIVNRTQQILHLKEGMSIKKVSGNIKVKQMMWVTISYITVF